MENAIQNTTKKHSFYVYLFKHFNVSKGYIIANGHIVTFFSLCPFIDL